MRPKKLDRLLLNLETRPSEGLDRRIAALISKAAEQGPGAVSSELGLWRRIMQSKTAKIAAAFAIVLVSIVAFHIFATDVTFAEVVKPLMTSRTVVFDAVVNSRGVTMRAKVMSMGQRTRCEIEPPQGPPIIIFDQERSQMLQLFPDKKQACLIDFNDLPDEYSENLLESMRNAIRELQDDPNVSIDRLPDSVVDGRNAVGFHAKSAQDEVTVWADPETLLPIRLEQIQYGLKLNIVCTNFQFDVELDPSLFSMDIPEGYRTASGQWDFGESSEKALLEGLRLWAQVLEDNQFPEDLSGATYLKMPGIKKKLRNGTLKLSRQQGLDMALNVMAPFFQFVTSLKPEQDWHYVGASVPFGDASKPVCWYKPIGSKTYRVVYGDLSVKDLPKEDLPK
jgi:outer membrane lipoprotein-sorting protein